MENNQNTDKSQQTPILSIQPQVSDNSVTPEVTQTIPDTPSSTVTPTPQTPSPSQPKKSNKVLKIGFFLIILGLLGMAGYMLFQNQIIKDKLFASKTTPTPTQTSTSSPTPTLDPTADWQTYTNNKYNFSFKYPLDWKVTTSPVTGNQFNIIVYTKFNTSEAGLVPIQFSVNMTYDDNGKPLVISSTEEAETHYIKMFSSNSVESKNINISNRSAISLTGVLAGPGPGEGNFLQYTFVQLSNEVLVIQLGNKEYQKIFDQILSTFRFFRQ